MSTTHGFPARVGWVESPALGFILATVLLAGAASKPLEASKPAQGEGAATYGATPSWDELRATYPGLIVENLGDGAVLLFGIPFGSGQDPADAAQRFASRYGKVLGAEFVELDSRGPLFDARHTQSLGYKKDTGRYRFTLVYYTQRRAGTPFRHQLQVCLIVLVAEERLLPAIAPLGHMMRKTGSDYSGEPRHGQKIPILNSPVKEICMVSPDPRSRDPRSPIPIPSLRVPAGLRRIS